MAWLPAESLTEEPAPFHIWTRDELDEEVRDSKKPQEHTIKPYPHGTQSRYLQGCRCGYCTEEKREINRRYQARLKARHAQP